MEIKLYEFTSNRSDKDAELYHGIAVYPGSYRFIFIENEKERLAYEIIFTSASFVPEQTKDIKLSEYRVLEPEVTIKLVRPYPNNPKEIYSPLWKECDFGYERIMDPLVSQLKEIVDKYQDTKPEFEEKACQKFIDFFSKI